MIYDVMMWNDKIGELEYTDSGSRFDLRLVCGDLAKIPYACSFALKTATRWKPRP